MCWCLRVAVFEYVGYCVCWRLCVLVIMCVIIRVCWFVSGRVCVCVHVYVCWCVCVFIVCVVTAEVMLSRVALVARQVVCRPGQDVNGARCPFLWRACGYSARCTICAASPYILWVVRPDAAC